MPEFQWGESLLRILSNGWQEYRGLGSIDHFAHSANLVHYLYVLIISVFVPHNAIRYVFMLLTHLVGGIGVFALLRWDILPALFPQQKRTRFFHFVKYPLWQFTGVALVAALFYQFNLMTIQMFHLPFELFVIHFAALPWSVLALRRFLQKGTSRALLLFMLVCLLGVSQLHVPTLFIPFSAVLGLVMFSHLFSGTEKPFRRVLLAGIVFLLVNSFWLLPYVYTTATHSAEISNAKMNRFSTVDIFYRNHAWADWNSISRFGGLHLGFYDWSITDNQFQPIMKDWLEFYTNPIYIILSSLLSYSALAGVGVLLLKVRNKQHRALSLSVIFIWLFTLLMLGTDLPVIKHLTQSLRESVPLFSQIFRFTFTKFSLSYVFGQSLLLAVFMMVVLRLGHTKAFARLRQSSVLVFYACIILFLGSLSFQRDFFYGSLRVALPEYYGDLFAYMQQEPKNQRVFPFPIHSFWGWTTNTAAWGYRGSGFVWQSIPQPVADRAFDWSKTNETAFNQLNRSLYELDQKSFQLTLQKYAVQKILFDTAIFHPGNTSESMFLPEIDRFLKENTSITRQRNFDNITLYDIAHQNKNLDPFAPNQVTLVDTSYTTEYTSRDQAYMDYGRYLQTADGISYPFSQLQLQEVNQSPYTEGLQQFRFSISENDDPLFFPPFSDSISHIPVAVAARITDTNLELKILPQLPKIYDNDNNLLTNNPESITQTIPLERDEWFISLGSSIFQINQNQLGPTFAPVGFTYLPTDQDLDALLFETIPEYSQNISESFASQPVVDCSSGSLISQPNTNLQLQNDTVPCITATINPLEIEQQISESEPTLIAISAEYRSNTLTQPTVCIQKSQSSDCLKTKAADNPPTSPGWQKLVVLAPVTSQENLSIRFSGQKQTGNNLPYDIEYRDIKILGHAFVAARNIPIATQVEALNAKLDEISAQKIQDATLELSFGENGQLAQVEPWYLSNYVHPPINCSFNEQGSISKNLNKNALRFSAVDQASLCDSYYYPYLSLNGEYLLEMSGEVESGSGLRVFLVNPLSKRFDLEFTTPQGVFHKWYPLYPSTHYEQDSDAAFQMNFNLESYGHEENTVAINKMRFYPLPLSWLSSIRTQPETREMSFSTRVTSIEKAGAIKYSLNVDITSPQGLVVLPQSFDDGWIAYRTGLIPQKVGQHVKFNGWANAWLLPEGEYTIVLLFWPQLLGFVGYVLVILTGTVLTTQTIQIYLKQRRLRQRRRTLSKILPIRQIFTKR